MRIIRKRTLAIIAALCLIISVATLLVANVGSTLAASQVDQIIAWAQARCDAGSTAYGGYCLKFVEEAYQAAGLPRSYDATAVSSGNRWIVSTSSTNIPVGAAVYYSGTTNNPAGHVAIYKGNGKVLDGSYRVSENAPYKAVEHSFTTSNYRGWGYPGGVAPYALRDGDYIRTPEGHIFRLVDGLHACYIRDWALVGGSAGKTITDINWDTFNSLNFNPIGCLDSASGGAGTLTVRGWAWDGDAPASAIIVDIYVGAPSGQGGKYVGGSKADKTRTDVNKAYPGLENGHGFEETINVSGLGLTGQVPVYVYAINVGRGNSNPQLINSPKTVTISAAVYTVTYNANGGSGAPASQTKTQDVSLALSSTKPTRNGYTFQGWATSAAATTATYQPGASYTANADLTLYAVWKADVVATTYTVTYNANGGTGAPAPQTKTENVNLTLTADKPTRMDYVFLGWATSATGNVAYQPGGSYTGNANLNLYAVWEAEETPPGKPKVVLPTLYHDTPGANVLNSADMDSNSFSFKMDYAESGQPIDFRLKLENYPGAEQLSTYGNYALTAYVTLSEGLTFDPGSVSVKAGGISFAPGMYSVSTADTNGATFKVTIPLQSGGQYPTSWGSALKAYIESLGAITVEYKAALNTSAVAYEPSNPGSCNTSTAVLHYNNDPSDSASLGYTVNDQVSIYTFRFSATSVDAADHGKLLAGAVFELRDSAEGPAIPLVAKGGNVYMVDRSATAPVTSIVTDESGKFTIEGLTAFADGLASEDGSPLHYYLVETQAPGGYGLPKDPAAAIDFRLNGVNLDPDSTITNWIIHLDAEMRVNGATQPSASILIENGSGTQLPETGGIGTMLFTVGGALLVAAAVVLFVAMRKRRKMDAA